MDVLVVACAFTSFAYSIGEPFVTAQKLTGAPPWDPRIGAAVLILVHGFAVFLGTYRRMSESDEGTNTTKATAAVDKLVEECIKVGGILGSAQISAGAAQAEPPEFVADAQKSLKTIKEQEAKLNLALLGLGMSTFEILESINCTVLSLRGYLGLDGGHWQQIQEDNHSVWYWRGSENGSSRKTMFAQHDQLLKMLRELKKHIYDYGDPFDPDAEIDASFKLGSEKRRVLLDDLQIPGEISP